METKKWMGALIAAAMFAAPAIAQDDMNVRGSATTGSDTQSTTEIQTETESDLGVGGSGEPGVQSDLDANVNADLAAEPQSDVYGGSGMEGTSDVSAPVAATNTEIEMEEQEKSDMRGLVVNLGGGVEGYTGALGDQLDAGPAWGVSAVLKPSKVLGIELGYSGAANEIGQDQAFQDNNEGARGADILRNGAHALATLGLTATPVQPYALAGLGISHYTVRANTASFDNDWSGAVPVGAGVRTHIGNFTADLRGTYSMLFDQDLATNDGAERSFLGEDFLTAGRWAGTLQIGTTW